VTSEAEIERELAACGIGYENFELQKKLFDHESSVSEKFENIEKSIETNNLKYENLATRFAELEKKFDERNEENAKEIREIKKMVEKISEMMRPEGIKITDSSM
jgi:predicted  nucleic acid-binding Zn-ribbon protein